MRPLQKTLGRIAARASYVGAFSKVTVNDYSERAAELARAIRSLRRLGMRVGLPHQTADGIMFFQVDDYALTVTQILELLDKNQLSRDGVRALVETQKE